MKDTFHTSAYGGDGWSPRQRTHDQELGDVWLACGISNEWSPLKSVILHRPGAELEAAFDNPGSVQMLQRVDIATAQHEHDQIAQAYRDNGVVVYHMNPAETPSANQMFCADLFAMTPHGAILARPASTVRAGEERVMAARLAEIGVPIIRTLSGTATFEGADLIWLNRQQAVVGVGLRTNREAVKQLSTSLAEQGTELLAVDMPYGTMHLMGMLRIVDHDLAIAWPRRTPHAAVMKLRECGFKVIFLPHTEEAEHQRAFNFVTLGPRKILTVAGNPGSEAFYQETGINCISVPATELAKAAGAIGCLTGIICREQQARD